MNLPSLLISPRSSEIEKQKSNFFSLSPLNFLSLSAFYLNKCIESFLRTDFDASL